MKNEPTGKSVIHIVPRWITNSGFKWGMRSQSIEGNIVVKLSSHQNFNELDRKVERLTGELYEDNIHEKGPIALVNRLVFWSSVFQRRFLLPVFVSGILLFKQKQDSGEVFRIVIPCGKVNAGIAVLESLVSWINRYFSNPQEWASTSDETFSQLEKTLAPFKFSGVNTYRFLEAAHQERIPVNHLTRRVFCYGYGSRSVWLNSSTTESTSRLGTAIAGNKKFTADILKAAGFPIADQRMVSDEDQAVKFAQQVGYPVVVKPADRERGVGVFAGLKHKQQVISAFNAAKKISKNILVEKHIEGFSHRFTVFHGRVIKITKKIPGGVFGDGKHTITELVNKFNQDPQNRRRVNERGILLKLDDEAQELLSEFDLTDASIPAEGDFVCLRRRSNVSAGGTSNIIFENQVHPDNLMLVTRVCKLVNLDLAGIDILSPDISKSWKEVKTTICEINAQPQISDNGIPQLLGNVLMELLGHKPRIPLMVIAGETTEVDWIELRTSLKLNYRATFSSCDGLWLDLQQIALPFSSGFSAAKSLLLSRDTDIGIILMKNEELEKHGLPCDTCDVLYTSDSNSRVAHMLGKNTQQVISGMETGLSANEVCREFLDNKL